ncbi:nicotinamide riboside transporter PnuC [Paenibacillus azoreducens]|uniref:Nicotinamide mononucleotide transporter n=1 Tax=Paenibacillus azoreducens TaxID=116718 RepID=A0A919YAW6_9BACL|nr:nicotinamide riboside transporter PnuC [Paenibacillus azoreducens]GIO45635.1 nicotinamide mononucleotide transporter [Paenibacillus azoreducens]
MVKHPLFVIIASVICIIAGLYLDSSYIEIFASVMGVINVWLIARQKVINFLFGAIAVACFMYIYFTTGLYAMTILALLQLWFNIYGWYYWNKTKGEEDHSPIARLTLKSSLIWSIVIIATTAIWSLVQIRFTDASNPYLDAFIAVIGLVAQYFLSKKILENWHLWILMNGIMLIVYFMSGLYVMILLTLINMFICFDGLFEWNRDYKTAMNKQTVTE